jgi:hypothetical protein
MRQVRQFQNKYYVEIKPLTIDSMKSHIIKINFRKQLDPLEAIQGITELFINHFQKNFDHLEYSLLDKSGFYWKLKTLGGKWTKKVWENYLGKLKLRSDKMEIDFSITKYLSQNVFRSQDIDLAVMYSINDYSNNITITIDDSNQYEPKNFIRDIVDTLKKLNVEITFGFMFAMERNKSHIFYSNGTGNPNLSQAEQISLGRLREQNNLENRCKVKIKEIFWGHVLSKKQISTSKNEFISIVGEDNFLELSDSLYWFNLPMDINRFNIDEYSKERQKLFDLLCKE